MSYLYIRRHIHKWKINIRTVILNLRDRLNCVRVGSNGGHIKEDKFIFLKNSVFFRHLCE
jgi:hypothetical protein